MSSSGSQYTLHNIWEFGTRSRFALECLDHLTEQNEGTPPTLTLSVAIQITRLLCQAIKEPEPTQLIIQGALEGDDKSNRACDDVEIAAFVYRLLQRARMEVRSSVGFFSAPTVGVGGVTEDSVCILLKTAREETETQEPDMLLEKVMPFNTWQVIKRTMKERWPNKSLKTIPDSNIRLLHKGIELGNNDMVDDYPMEGGTKDNPVQISYLIVGDRGEKKCNLGIYVDPQVQVCTSRHIRDRVLHAGTSFRRGICPQLTLEGTGATYFIRDADNKHIVAVFKPKDEEACAPQNPRGYVGKENSIGFRQGVYSTQQAAREVAAYLLDHDKFAGVPETTLVHAKHPKFVTVNGKSVWKVGAFQAFVETKDSAGNFAPQVFGTAHVHRIGILDIRIVNLDRNDGNLLVAHARAPGAASSEYKLVPIDHGLSLPDRLEVYTDDLAWMSWPQARKPFGEREREYIKSLNGARDAKLLDKYLGVRRECLRLMEMTTLLVQLGAELGLTLFEIGSILYRVDRGSDAPVQQSVFERMLERCLDMALIVVGDGSAPGSATLAGLDLQRPRATATRERNRVHTPAGSETSDIPISPFRSPLVTTSTVSGEMPPHLSLDGASSDNAFQSPEIVSHLSIRNRSNRFEDLRDQVLDPVSTTRMTRQTSTTKGTGTATRRHRTTRGTLTTEGEGRGREKTGQIFARPELRANDWPAELELLFKEKVVDELRKYITKNFERSLPEDASEDKSTSLPKECCPNEPADDDDDDDDDGNDFSLASAFGVRPADVITKKPIKRYVPPMMRQKAKTQEGEEESTPPAGNVDEAQGEDTSMHKEHQIENSDPNAKESSQIASTSEADSEKTLSESLSTSRKYVPPMMRKKLEEAGALPSVPEDNSSTRLGNDSPSEASKAPKQKYIPPQARNTPSLSSTAPPPPAESTELLSKTLTDVSTAPPPSEQQTVSSLSRASTEGLPTDAAAGTDRFGWCVNQGPRPGMEDAIDAMTQLPGEIPTEFYAVYDGHSGTAAVEFIIRRLPQMLRQHDGFNDPSRTQQVLYDAFMSLDEELLEYLQGQVPQSLAPATEATGDNYALSSGCVATVALVRENRIHISNLGDCRAVLCRNGSMIPLTVDHHPTENAAEKARLEALGVEVSNDGYLHGRIGVSRAFGDLAWHAKEKCLGLSCEPELYEAEISEDTEFLLLACDGIFEKMSTDEAGKTVRRKLRATRDAKASAEALIKTAVKMNGTDNLSAVVVVFNPPPSIDGDRVAPRLLFKPRQPLTADGAA